MTRRTQTQTAARGIRVPRRQGPTPNDNPPALPAAASAWEPLFAVLRQCRQCGFVRADLELSPDEIAAIYGEQYFRGEEYGDYLAESDLHRRNFERRIEEITAVAGRLKSVFEVGCASMGCSWPVSTCARHPLCGE